MTARNPNLIFSSHPECEILQSTQSIKYYNTTERPIDLDLLHFIIEVSAYLKIVYVLILERGKKEYREENP